MMVTKIKGLSSSALEILYLEYILLGLQLIISWVLMSDINSYR